MLKSVVLPAFCLFIHSFLPAQSKIDVLQYKYAIDLNDNNDSIKGKATIVFVAIENTNEFILDLSAVKGKKGMKVSRAEYACEAPSDAADLAKYTQLDEKLFIQWTRDLKKGDTAKLCISYEGVPSDGLIISKSKFGKRTFFSDNWPNRAHHWIPCHDDPADKASVEFSIIAPPHYKAVSNGVLIEEKMLENDKKRTTWKEEVPLPTKIMVIGVADFAVDTSGVVNGIPVTSWVFPENSKDGFYDYALAPDILSWMINYIGPFPYKKLANVQSKTIFGGMENASVIFYYENSVNGKRSEEPMIAHEIAHQYFGDMATEKSFSHLWLSEGFASYLSHLYLESKYGVSRLAEEMQEDRQKVVDFGKSSDLPVVDSVTPYMQLLNANSYQKGAWILHMLRRQLGDTVFHQIIRNYYATYAGKNADTKDFQKTCEQIAGKDLSVFFQQWLYTPDYPELEVKWKYDVKQKKLLVTVTQLQAIPFTFPLDILIQTSSGRQVKKLAVSKQTQSFSFQLKEKPVKIVLDPATSLLFEGRIN